MNPQDALATGARRYPCPMAQVTEKRADGAAVVVVPPDDAADLEVGEVVDVRPTGRDPLDELIASAPEDDEPLTAEEEESIREARADRATGRMLSAEDARRELLG